MKKRFSHFWSTLAGKPAKDEIPLLPELQAFGCPVRRGRLHLLFTEPGRNLKGTAADTGSPFSSAVPAHEELMSNAAVNRAWLTHCKSHAEKLVLLFLSDKANDENGLKVWHGITSISIHTGVSRSGVIRAIASLRKRRLLTVKRTGRSNLYRLPPVSPCDLRSVTVTHQESQGEPSEVAPSDPKPNTNQIETKGKGSPSFVQVGKEQYLKAKIERLEDELSRFRYDNTDGGGRFLSQELLYRFRDMTAELEGLKLGLERLQERYAESEL